MDILLVALLLVCYISAALLGLWCDSNAARKER